MMTTTELDEIRELLWRYRDALLCSPERDIGGVKARALYVPLKRSSELVDLLKTYIKQVDAEIEDRRLGQTPQPDPPAVYLTAREAKVALAHMDALHGEAEPDDEDKIVLAKLLQISSRKD